MSVRQQSKYEMVTALWERYWGMSRAERGRLLNTVVEATGCHRKYALALLRDVVPKPRPTNKRWGPPTTYGVEVIAALRAASRAIGCL